MATAASPRRMMYAQIVSQPALLLEVFDATERAVQDAFTHFQPQHWQAIYTAGCGDSFYAGLACEMAFARFCRLPVKALSAMQFARYEADRLPPTCRAVWYLEFGPGVTLNRGGGAGQGSRGRYYRGNGERHQRHCP